MKRFLFILLTLACICSFASQTPMEISEAAPEYVYVCTGGYATKYHSRPNCRGLNNCKGKVIKITKAQALKQGRTACKICY